MSEDKRGDAALKPPPPASAGGKQRIAWIDVAKGIGIVLVSFGHIRNGDGQSVWLPALDDPIGAIYLFHMPLFFFLGGLTFSGRRPFKAFLAHKMKTLLVPYYVFSVYFLAKPIAVALLPSLSSSFRSSHDYRVWMQFYDVLINGNGLWFLWAFFVGEVLTYGIVHLIGSRRFDLIIGCALIAAYTAVTHIWPGLVLPFQILRGVEIAGFVLLGMSAKRLLLRLTRPVCVAVFLFSFIAYAMAAMAVVRRTAFASHAAVPVETVAMFLGISAFTALAMVIGRGKVLEYVGRFSLVFYAVNALMLNVGKLVFFKVLPIDGPNLGPASQWTVGFSLVAFSMALMWIANLVIQRWFRWTVGAPKPTRKH